MKFAARTLLLAFASTAIAQVVAITPVQAAECLLDTNNDGVADAADTDGGAESDGTPSTLACGNGASTLFLVPPLSAQMLQSAVIAAPR